MKTFIPLITIAAMPFLGGGSFGFAQDQPDAVAPPGVKVVEDPFAKANALRQPDLARQDSDQGNHLSAQPMAAGPAFADRLQNIIKRTTDATMVEPSARPLVIRTSTMDPKDQANLEEDLVIMAKVLDKALQPVPEPNTPYRAMGIDLFGSSSSPAMRNLYLDGYGALFMLRVGFPLVPPPPGPAEPKKEDSETDSAWEQAKQELYGQGQAGMPPGPAQEFNEAKVSQLKAQLLEALKSASNIRELKPSESVTVCIFGGAGSGRFIRSGLRTHASATAGQPSIPADSARMLAVDHRGKQRGTVMTLRAKKSDIDAFAKGKLDHDEFSKTVKIEAYMGAEVSGGMAVFGGGGGLGGFGGGVGQMP
jgi:hypothetical protein